MNEHERQDIQNYLKEEICGCYNCQPWEGGEPVWIEPKSDLYDLLQDYEVEEKDMEEALEGFDCPRCGTSLEEPYAAVSVKTEYDRQVAKIFDELDNDKITKRLVDFNNFITSLPYLSILHPVGKDIFACIGKAPTFDITNEKWFRARLLNDESRIFSSDEMKAPDPNRVYIKEGRYNHTGQSFLYLSSDSKTAFLEIKSSKENTCVMQEFTVSNLKNILDLRFNYNDIPTDVDIIYLALIYNGYLDQVSEKKSSWKPEYFIPRFVADAARNYGYSGIIYTSAASLFGSNLTIFDCKSNNIAPNNRPFLYEEEKHPLDSLKGISRQKARNSKEQLHRGS